MAEMWDYIPYLMNAPFGSTRGTNLKMCNRKSIVRGVGSSHELARTSLRQSDEPSACCTNVTVAHRIKALSLARPKETSASEQH